MQARAWWLTTVSGVILLASSCLLAAPPKAGATRGDIDRYMQTQKAAMESADADGATRIRLEVESGLSKDVHGGTPSAEFVIDYVTSATDAFGPLITGQNKDARLAATILLARLSKSNEAPDLTLESALKSKDPSIRYWAAKGYTNIIPKYLTLSQTLRDSALRKVRTALQAETDPLVKAELYRALEASKDQSSETGMLLLNDIKPMVADMKGQAPTASTLNAVTQGLNTLQKFVAQGGKFSAEDRGAVLQLTAEAASFPVQHLMAIEAKDASLVTSDAQTAAYQTVRAAYNLASVLAPEARLAFRGAPPSGKAEWLKEFSLQVGFVFGSPTVPGQLQKAIGEVPAPAAVGK